MNKKKTTKKEMTCHLAIFLFLSILLLFTACAKNSSNNPSSETSADTDEPTEEVIGDIEEIVADESTEVEIDIDLAEESAEEELEFEEVLDDKEEFADEVLADIEEKPIGKVFEFPPSEHPEFPGGEDALNKFIMDNMRYPSSCAEEGKQGIVTLLVVITTDGSIKGVEVFRSPDERFTKEAKRIVAKMPKWKPGKHNGEAVNSQRQIRFRFILP